MPFVYLDKRAAELWAEDHKEEWVDYSVKSVEVRQLTEQEGAVGTQLVQIRRDTAKDAITAKAMKKLTAEERSVLGLRVKL